MARNRGIHCTNPTRRLTGFAAICAVLLVCACTPTTGGGPTSEVAPIISAFTASGVTTSPALITLKWNISDANGDSLTCDLDSNGDGTVDVTITNCSNSVSRNVPLATGATATTFSPILTISDGTESTTRTTSVTITPGVAEPFNITLRGLDSLDSQVRAVFESAASRWESVITRGLPDLLSSPSACDSPSDLPKPTSIDDIVIDAEVAPIDGSGSILGQAGPTCVLNSSQLTIMGIMSFDSADVADMLDDGLLESVIQHEMGHVLGIGTLWDTTSLGGTRTLLSGAGTSNPMFTGAAATAEASVLGLRGAVPVENTGGSGTRDAHWRESIFGTELMTGWADQGAELSAMSIASLADLGYHVDLNAADSYALPGSALRGGVRADNAAAGEIERPEVTFASADG